jgi:predicted MFS family arabinose efflux permease
MPGNVFSQLKEGLQYIRNERALIGIFSLVGIVGVFASGMLTLIPAWSVNVLHGDAATNGLMLSARGFGSMAAGILIAWLSRFHLRGKSLSAGSFLLPVVMVLFALVTDIPSSLVFLCLTGFFFMLVINNANAMIQTSLPDQLRGRVMSIYVLVFFGSQPIGSLVAGQLAESTSEPISVLVFAACLFLCSLYIRLRLPNLRKLE